VDIQVQELIEKIRKDGIDSASQEAAGIKSDASAEARKILDSARKEAADIVETARRDAERSEKAGIAALEQASRNLLLVFRDEVQTLLDKIVAREVSSAYDGDVLKKALPEVISAWGKKGSASGADSLDLLLGEASLGSLRAFLEDKLASELKSGLELKPDSGISSGFRIANRDGSAYYDFSGESVAAMLCAYLNPRLAGIMASAAKG
jgi:V/A-type H+-transporting ATPase subunit E